MQGLAVAHLACRMVSTQCHVFGDSLPLTEVVREGITPQEADKAVQLAHTVLKRRPGEAPSVLRLKLESGLSSVRLPLLDVVRLVEL